MDEIWERNGIAKKTGWETQVVMLSPQVSQAYLEENIKANGSALTIFP